MDANVVYGVLLYGRARTRHDLAARLAREDEPDLVRLLANTARQPGRLALRARSLEVLGLFAAEADEETLRELLDMLFSEMPGTTDVSLREAGLTARQLEIAQYVSRGLGNAEIARRLKLSERTVENHMSRMLGRLGLESRVQLAVYLHNNNFSTDALNNRNPA